MATLNSVIGVLGKRFHGNENTRHRGFRVNRLNSRLRARFGNVTAVGVFESLTLSCD